MDKCTKERTETYVDKVFDAIDSLKEISRLPMLISREQFKLSMVSFMKETDSNYPDDVFNVFDVMKMLAGGERPPHKDSMKILKAALKYADFYHGETSWKYNHPNLFFSFTPKHSAAYYTIEFISGSNTHSLCFPLKVVVTAYTDMDEKSSHNEFCPIYYPEHEDDCPVVQKMLANSEVTEEDFELCECADTDCNCESEVERQHSTVFEGHEDFNEHFQDWLLAAHWNNFDE